MRPAVMAPRYERPEGRRMRARTQSAPPPHADGYASPARAAYAAAAARAEGPEAPILR